MASRTKPAVLRKNGLDLDYQRHFSVCSQCGAEFATQADHKQSRKSLVAAEAAELEAPSAEVIAEWRDRLGITQVDAGKLTRTGRVSFCKYETRVTVPSGPTSVLLDVLMNCPQALRYVARKRGVQLRPGFDAIPVEIVPGCVAVGNISFGETPAAVLIHMQDQFAAVEAFDESSEATVTSTSV